MPTITITTRSPGRLQRAWYRRLHVTPPLAEGGTGPRYADIVRLLPYRWRRFHHAFAAANGFFWAPCVLCSRPFGGHEAGEAIPDPTDPPLFIVVCSQCTRSRSTAP